MIDLHCHLLPGIDDGASDVEVALEMARIAVADGIRTTACTPHIYPGLFENASAGIAARVSGLQRRLREEGVDLGLVVGADAHLTPELLGRLRAGTGPDAGGQPLLPARAVAHGGDAALRGSGVRFCRRRLRAGDHAPRAAGVDRSHYATFATLVHGGAWMQVTAGSLRRPVRQGRAVLRAEDARRRPRPHPRHRRARHAAPRAAAQRRARGRGKVGRRRGGATAGRRTSAGDPRRSSAAGSRAGAGVAR